MLNMGLAFCRLSLSPRPLALLCLCLVLRCGWSQGLQPVAPIVQLPNTQVGATAQGNILLQVTGAPISITGFTFANSEGGVPEFVAGTVAGCAVDGSTSNAVGTTCSVAVTFKPAYPGLRQVPLKAVTSGGTFYFGMSGLGQAAQVSLTPGNLSTLAGTGVSGDTGDSGTSFAATLNHPARTAVDSQGNVFIADAGNHAIREIVASTGKIILLAGNGTACATPTAACGDGGLATSASLSNPSSVAVDASGNLFIADSGDNRIRRVDASSGLITTVAGTGSAAFAGDMGPATAASIGDPQQVIVDFAGNLYIAAAGDNAVRYVSAETGVITTLAGDGTVCSPTTDACGDGGVAAGGQSKLNAPHGIARDAAGNLYIADTGDNRVRRIDATSGQISTVAGTGTAGYSGDSNFPPSVPPNFPPTMAQLNAVGGVDVDAAGNLYLADTGNAAVRLVLSSNNLIFTIAGGAAPCAAATAVCGDGSVSTGATLISPQGAALDSFGDLYIADSGENRIRKVYVVEPTFTFASTATGTMSSDSPEVVLVTNIGNETLTPATPSSGTTNPAYSSGFTYDGNASYCPLFTSSSTILALPAGYGCRYGIDYQPVTTGPTTGSLVFSGDALNDPLATQSVLLRSADAVISEANQLTSTNSTPNYGDQVTFTDTIPISEGLVPTGTVIFYNGATSMGSVSVPSSGVVTFTTSSLPIGMDSITAAYSGDANYTPKTSNTVVETIGKATATGMLLTSNMTPMFGQAVTFTDTFPAVNGTYPSGTITFYNGSTSIGTGLLTSGVATLSTSALPGGTDTITAVFAGDANFQSGRSNPISETVTQAGGSDVLTASTSSTNLGQTVTFTDMIPVVNRITPTGAVTFYNGATFIGSGSSISPLGVSTLSITTLLAGTDSITAFYSGDSNYASNTSNPVTVIVAKASTTNLLKASTMASVVGQPVTFTATVSVVAGFAPTGTVTFYNGAAAIGNGRVNASGVAILMTTSLPVGSDTITATYGGDTNYTAASSQSVNVLVSPSTVGTVDILTASPSSSVFGQSVTLTDTVSGTAGVTPTGTVTFLDSAAAIGTASLSGAGVATFSTTGLSVGSHSITATYSGNAGYHASTSNTVTVHVGSGDFTIAVTPSYQIVDSGGSATYTVSLSGAGASFEQAVLLSATGLPPDASVNFSPVSVNPGAGPTTSAMTIRTPSTQADLTPSKSLQGIGYAMLLLPLLGWRRFRYQLNRSVVFGLLLLASLGGTVMLTGCGSGTFTKNYVITVTGTSGSVQHAALVRLGVN